MMILWTSNGHLVNQLEKTLKFILARTNPAIFWASVPSACIDFLQKQRTDNPKGFWEIFLDNC